VVEGRTGVPGLIVEARTTTPVKTIARATSGEKGDFVLEIADVAALKKELGMAADEPLVVTLAALKGRRIIARSEAAFEAKPRESVSASLKLG
jgi:hypothetical protein